MCKGVLSGITLIRAGSVVVVEEVSVRACRPMSRAVCFDVRAGASRLAVRGFGMDPGLLMDLSEESVLVLARAALVLVVEEEIVEPEVTLVRWTAGFAVAGTNLAPESTLVSTLALGSTRRLS